MFKSTVRSQKSPDIFPEKGPVTASLECLYSDHGVASEHVCCSIAFLRSCWGFSALSTRFHCAHNACTALSQRLHCVDDMFKTQ